MIGIIIYVLSTILAIAIYIERDTIKRGDLSFFMPDTKYGRYRDYLHNMIKMFEEDKKDLSKKV